MGGSDLGTCANITRVILFIINVLFAIFGIIVLAVGIWTIVRNQDYAFLTGNSIISGGALLIVCGTITIIISAIGMIGVLFKLRPLLVIYAVVILIIVILEVIAAILTFVFGNRVEAEVQDRVFEAIRDYRAGAQDNPERMEDVNDAINTFQEAFDCCGYTNASDWIMINPEAIVDNGGRPPSCPKCNITTDSTDKCATFYNNTLNINFTTTRMGCNDASNTGLAIFAYTIGGLGIAFGILELLGICFSLALCCCITSARKDTVV